jgi:hypothetical protein
MLLGLLCLASFVFLLSIPCRISTKPWIAASFRRPAMKDFRSPYLKLLRPVTPLILSRASGNRDLDSSALNGVHWTDAGDVADLARATHDWIGIAQMATNHRKVALDHFQQNSCFDRLVEQYQKSLHLAKFKARGIGVSSVTIG